jgi:hypothetical protein
LTHFPSNINKFAFYYQQAGITTTQLKLVLEPEAASLFGQATYTQRDVQAGGITELKHFRPGQKYILADLGGTRLFHSCQLHLL